MIIPDPLRDDGAQVVATASWLSPSVIKAFDDELAALVDRGFTPVLALRSINAVTQYVNGFVLQEQIAARRRSKVSVDPLGALADVLPSESKTPLRTAIRAGASTVGDAAFEHGLRALVVGTVSALDSSSARRSRRHHGVT